MSVSPPPAAPALPPAAAAPPMFGQGKTAQKGDKLPTSPTFLGTGGPMASFKFDTSGNMTSSTIAGGTDPSKRTFLAGQ